MREVTLGHYRTFLEKLNRFYNERELAFRTAIANNDDKRLKIIFFDTKAVFGAMCRDRRSDKINNPEIWSCQLKR